MTATGESIVKLIVNLKCFIDEFLNFCGLSTTVSNIFAIMGNIVLWNCQNLFVFLI